MSRDVLLGHVVAKSEAWVSLQAPTLADLERLAGEAFARLPASSRSVTDHSHGLPAQCSSWRTRPITRPSKMATPSIPGALSGKVRRQVTLVAFIAVAFMARLAAGPQ